MVVLLLTHLHASWLEDGSETSESATMNNIRQKNVILQNAPCTDLPYKTVLNVDHYACAETINAIDVNNLAGQMADNDLYIENALKNLSASAVGPKILDASTIASQPDGYKVFGDLTHMNNVRILHKVEIPLSSTITKLMSGNIQMLHQAGNAIFLAKDGHLFVSKDPSKENWVEVKSGSSERVDARFGLNVGFECLFAASDGVYQLSSYGEGTTSTTYSAIKLNAEQPHLDARCVAVDDKSQMMLVGTPTGILSSKYNITSKLAEISGKLKFTKIPLYYENDFVDEDSFNDIKFLKPVAKAKKLTAVAASKTALYRKSTTNNLEGKRTFQLDGASERFKSAKLFNNRMVFATTAGLYAESLVSTEILDLMSYESGLGASDIVKLEAVGDSALLVATSSAIYSLNSWMNECTKLMSVGDLENKADDEQILSFCTFGSSELVFGATTKRLFFVDLSIREVYGKIYPQTVMDDNDFKTILNNAFSGNSGLREIDDIVVAGSYLLFVMKDIGLASLKYTLAPNSSSERIVGFANVNFGKMIGTNNKLLKFLTCDGARVGVLEKGFECIDRDDHPILSSSNYNLVDAVAVSYDNLAKDCIAALDKNGTVYLVRFDYASGTFTQVKNSIAKFGSDGVEIEDFNRFIVVRGSQKQLSSAAKADLFSSANAIKVIECDSPLSSMASHENQLYLIDEDRKITKFIETEILTDIGYHGAPIRSMAQIASLSTQVLATSAGLLAYSISSSNVVDDTLQVNGFWTNLTGTSAKRVALLGGIGIGDPKAYWITDGSQMKNAWLSSGYSYDDNRSLLSIALQAEANVGGTETKLSDMVQFVNPTTGKEMILATGVGGTYKVNSLYATSAYNNFNTSTNWSYLACLGECNLPIMDDITDLAFIIGTTGGLSGSHGEIGYELSDLQAIKETSKKGAKTIKKILYGGYDIVYLADGDNLSDDIVYEVYAKDADTISVDNWKLSSTLSALSGIVDIDRIPISSQNIKDVDKDYWYYVDSYVTLGACKQTIFRKRRNDYSEQQPKNHILSVSVSVNNTGFTSSSKDYLARTSYDIKNLDHIKTSKEIDVLAATAGGIEVFKLKLPGNDDSATLQLALTYPVSNLGSAYFIDENRIIFKTTGSGDIKCIQLDRTNETTLNLVKDEDKKNVIVTTLWTEAKYLLKAQNIDDRNLPFIIKTNGTIINCLFDEEIGTVSENASLDGITVRNIQVAEDDTVYVLFNRNGKNEVKRFRATTGGTLSWISVGGAGIAYANGEVFIVGNNRDLSSYPLSNSNEIKNLGGTELIGCNAYELSKDKTRLVAYTKSRVFEKDINAHPTSATDSLTDNDLVHDIRVSMCDLYTIPNQNDQLIANAYHNGKTYTSNIFYDKVLDGKIKPGVQVYLSESGKIMFANGKYILNKNGVDETSRVVKFIKNPDSDDQIYVMTTGHSVLTFPGGSKVLSGDDCIDAVCRYGSEDQQWKSSTTNTWMRGDWFWKSSTTSAWMYIDRGSDVERILSSDIDLASATRTMTNQEYLLAGGQMYAPTDLRQTKLESKAGPTLSIKSECKIDGLGISKGGLQANMTLFNNKQMELYEVDINTLQSTNVFTSKKKAIYGFDETDSQVELKVSGLWMVDQDPRTGLYAKTIDSSLTAYDRWLCKLRYGTSLDPLRNVDFEVSSMASGSGTSIWALAGDKATVFTGYGNIDVFEIVPNSLKVVNDNNDRFTKMCVLSSEVGGSRVLLAAEDGIHTYDADTGLLGILKSTLSAVNELRHMDVGDASGYVYTIDNRVLSSSNARIWKKIFDLPDGVNKITDVVHWSPTQYLFGTHSGLYSTEYKYNMVDDIHSFTKSNALCMYNNLLSSTLSGECIDVLQTHLCSEHSTSSFMTHVNNDFLSVAFDDIDSSWQKMIVSSDEAITIKNDIIADMQFGSYYDGDVIASISNFTTGGQIVDLSTATYIMKRWMSGVTELFINIPSTRTYYLNNLYGAGDCRTLSSIPSQRKNLEGLVGVNATQDGNVAKHATEIQLGITSSEYHIDNLLAVEINGQSLPLKIYRDAPTNASDDPKNMFRSYIEPSVVKSWDISKTDKNGNYIFKFACFGSDAQAIHLMFYDKNARSGSKTFVVTFDPNGGDGIPTKQKFMLSKDSRGYPVIEQKQLKKNRFTNTSSGYDKTFAGWSLYPKPDNDLPDYTNQQVFPKASQWSNLSAELLVPEASDTLKDKDGVTLYAVWSTQRVQR